MNPHRVRHRVVTLPSGQIVEIKFWAAGNRIYVAAFDSAGNQVSAARYSAEVELADDLYAALQHSLIDSLAGTVESDLLTNPELHYVPAK